MLLFAKGMFKLTKKVGLFGIFPPKPLEEGVVVR